MSARTVLGRITALLAAGLAGCAAHASTGTSGRPVAVARAIGLRPGDLPGFRVQPNVTVTDDAAGLRRCLGIGARPLAVQVSPPLQGLEHGRLSAAVSVVMVMPGRSAARGYVAAAGGGRGRGCAATSVRRRSARAGSRPAVRTASLPVAGRGQVGIRILLSGGALAAGAVEHIDGISFAAGPVVVMLQTSSIGGPFPPALERRLVRTLEARAHA